MIFFKPKAKDKEKTNQMEDNDLSEHLNNINNEDKKTERNTNQTKQKKKKNNNFFYGFIIIFIILSLYMFIKDTLRENNQNQKMVLQEQTIQQTNKQQSDEKTEVVNLSQEEEAIKRMNGEVSPKKEENKNINTENNIDFNSWKKNIIAALGDTNIVDFYLDDDHPQIITRNFKQDGKRNFQISGTDARIDKIILQPSEDFLDIVVKIISNDKTKSFDLKYPLLKYTSLHFFDDSVVKVFGKNNIILTENSYIFPYLKIEKIGSDKDGKYMIFYVKQKDFKGEDFLFRYNIKE